MTHVVVVGGGASGVLAAAALAARGATATVVERAERAGPGLAYGAADAHHLLNSPAGRMGAVDPGGFTAWAARTGAPIADGDYAARRRFGDYLTDVLDGLVAAGAVEVVRGEAVRPADGPGAGVVLADGRRIAADAVVLALGNPPPPGRALASAAPVHVPDPWAAGALDDVGGRVLLVGTGLTTIDVATRLARRDPAVRMTATSRHLLLPRVHLAGPVPAGPGIAPDGPSLGAVVSAFGRRLRAARAAGTPWQAEVDGVRPQVDALWRALPLPDRRRFVQRVSRRWEVHRHRMAPAVAAELAGLRADGRLVLSSPGSTGVPDAVVDCTGPRPFPARGWSRLVDTLLDSGSARADPLGLGLDIDADGALLDGTGRPSGAVFVLGPARRGVQWECTAVPEIRAAAAALADLLTRS